MANRESGQDGFGKWLRQKRRALDLTQESFADQIGCARITLRRIESGGLKPSKELALILLEKAGIPHNELDAWLLFARGLADQPQKQTVSISIPTSQRNNLPASLTTFIGREKELADVLHLLAQNRLVTLTGSGGVGKTRLSIQAAMDLLPEYPVGVWLVELAPLTDPALVPQAVCAVMGVKPNGGTSAFEALTNYLRSKKLLLVLDNCEHLVEACAQLCASLLRDCTDLHILASSREALGIDGEQGYRVPSLSLPNSNNVLSIIQGSEAVTLFVERAASVQPEFALTETNAPFIAQICHRLDGIALAIELAASRVKMFKVEQIALKLDDAFGLLTSGNRTALPRQQTLRALIDWSYNLLSEEEKTFLRKLSVFMGGCTLEVAIAIWDNKNALELLGHLVDKSLVSVDVGHDNEPRYYLLETIRQYSRVKLFKMGEERTVRDQHLLLFIAMAEKAEPEIRGFEQLYWLDRLDEEIDNLRAALEWAQESNIESFLRLASALWRFWGMRGHTADLEWLPRALVSTEELKTVLRAQSLGRAAFVASSYGDAQREKKWTNEAKTLSLFLNYPSGLAMALILQSHFETHEVKKLEYLEQALTLAKNIGDHWLIAAVLTFHADLFLATDDLILARSFLEQSVQKARDAGDKRLIGWGVRHLGMIALVMGDAIQAKKWLYEALSYARELKDVPNIYMHHSSIITAKIYLEDSVGANDMIAESLSLAQTSKEFLSQTYLYSGWIELSQAKNSIAIKKMEEGLLIAKETKNLLLTTNITFWLAEAWRRSKIFDQAVEKYIEAFAIFKDVGFTKINCNCFCSLGMFSIDKGQVKTGIYLLGASENFRSSIFALNFPFMIREQESSVAIAREKFTESEFNAAWAEGQSMSQEQVLALAMEVLQ